jgi:hypothetical protein
MVGGNVLGTGFQVDVEQREAFGAVGTTIASIISIFRQIADYAYQVATWLIKTLTEKPFECIQGAFSIAILLS